MGDMADWTIEQGDDDDADLDFCDHCGEDFRYDDTGGYNPPCKCGLNCASCCEHGSCHDRDDDGDLSYPDDYPGEGR